MSNNQPPNNPPPGPVQIPNPEVLPREQDFSRGYKEKDEKPTSGADAAKRTRERSRELKEKEKDEEITERGMLIELMGKIAISEGDKNRLLEIWDKSRLREGQRRNDFELSQRQYLWFMMADKERDMMHIRNTNDAFIQLLNNYAAVQQSSKKSTTEEVLDAVNVVLQLPIFVALQGLLVDKLTGKKPLKNKTNEKLRKQLLKQIAQLEAQEEDEDDE